MAKPESEKVQKQEKQQQAALHLAKQKHNITMQKKSFKNQ